MPCPEFRKGAVLSNTPFRPQTVAAAERLGNPDFSGCTDARQEIRPPTQKIAKQNQTRRSTRAVTATAIKLWDAYCCPRSRGIGQNRGEIAMKTILSALVALSVIAGVTGTASVLDAKTVFEQIDRD